MTAWCHIRSQPERDGPGIAIINAGRQIAAFTRLAYVVGVPDQIPAQERGLTAGDPAGAFQLRTDLCAKDFLGAAAAPGGPRRSAPVTARWLARWIDSGIGPGRAERPGGKTASPGPASGGSAASWPRDSGRGWPAP